MLGRCLCGDIEFELVGEIPRLYQCHCSLCRKVTGSAANAALCIPARQLRWRAGTELIRRYASDSGYQSHFCGRCGSPVPNLTHNDQAYWVPAGLLEQDSNLELAAHFFITSRARWDTLGESGERFDTMPFGRELDDLLSPNKPLA